MSAGVVVGIGEILWDVFPDGPRFGGAPANFACSAAGLSNGRISVEMVSAVGDDPYGPAALQALRDHGVGVEHVSVVSQQTGQVLVQLDEHGKATYEFARDTAWDNLHWHAGLRKLAAHTSVVCFGTLGQRSIASRHVIQAFISYTPGKCLRIFDVNLRPPFWTPEVITQSLTLASILKLNDDELQQLAVLLELSGNERQIAEQLLSMWDLQLLVLTRGDNGSLLLSSEEQFSELPGEPVVIADTVGAGDAFTATIAIGLLKGVDLKTLHRRAADVAAFVCSQAGATPSIPPALRFV